MHERRRSLQRYRSLRVLFLGLITSTALALTAAPARGQGGARAALERIGMQRGICVVLGLPDPETPGFVIDLARNSEWEIYFQSPVASEVTSVREAAERAGLLGRRVYADRGKFGKIHLAENLAGAVLVGPAARGDADREELLRVLHPGGKAIVGDDEIAKPFPADTDVWSHPYHGPDNNPQSTDRRARAPYRTQFLADPKFCPMPEVSVAAGGRVFRAFGHIAHKANQNAMLNTLICVNAYNGIILWQRKLTEGFMIHRNTLIATPDTLYLGDDRSLKRIDAATGKVRDEIVLPRGTADGPVWKWMALENGILYALVGGAEDAITTRPSNRPGLGHWPWGMWDGHDYRDPKSSFGFGRTIVAIRAASREILWKHDEKEYIDSRGLCMKNGRIYYYAPGKFLACLDAGKPEVLWKSSDPGLLGAIGPNGRAQHYVTGYATTTYIKCTDDHVFFAGPQRNRLVTVRAADGELLWQKPHGNLQLVLREDGIYAAGPQTSGARLAYTTGEELGKLPTRRACTRATGSIDSVFYRTRGGTVRVDTDSNTAQHIAPMRPPCQDGVIISDGNLYWGPWMCGCQLSLYGHIGLTSARHSRSPAADPRLETGPGDWKSVADLEVRAGDWPAFLGNSGRRPVTRVSLPRDVRLEWRFRPPHPGLPTAPVAAGGLVFVGNRDGVVRALDSRGRERWKAYTGGAIYFPPAVADGRVFVGSADGRVHAFEAASGRELWRHHVAPARRWIPVYGTLISTWPVAGGVVVEDGVVLAAAGIAHYDGTHVVALDAVTGAVRWRNDTSGALAERVNGGVSLQGYLSVDGGELRFRGGGVYQLARYDLKTGACANEPEEVVTSRFQTAFYPYFPEYSRFQSLLHTFPDGKSLFYNASYEGSQHTNLALLAPAPAGTPPPPPRTDRPSDRANRRAPTRKIVWETSGHRYTSFVVAPGVLLAAGESAAGEGAFLAALQSDDGSRVWRRELPAPVVKGGAAVDADGRITVSLRDGQILCYGAKTGK